MKPLQHAQISAKRYGGTWQDWFPLHTWFDSSKAIFASMQHRVFLHSDFGVWLACGIFGPTITSLSDGTTVPTQELAVDHIVEDIGSVKPLSDWLKYIRPNSLPLLETPKEFTYIKESPAEGLAAKHGGSPEQYTPLVQFFNKPQELTTNPAALYITHNSFGIFLAEQLLGPVIEIESKNNSLRLLSTRAAAEDLVIAKIGLIPTAAAIANRLKLANWMKGSEVVEGLKERAARYIQNYRGESPKIAKV